MFLARHILKGGWIIAWGNKKYWLFGILAAILGTTGESELILNSTNFGQDTVIGDFFKTLRDAGLFSIAGIKGIFQLLRTDPLAFFQFFAVLLLIFGILLIFGFLIIIAQGALIHGTHCANLKKRPTLHLGFKTGLKKFFPLLGLALSQKILFALLFFGLWKIIFAKDFFFIILFDIVFFIVIIISLILKFSTCFVVLHDSSFLTGIKNGIRLFYKNRLKSIELAALLFIVNTVVGVILVLGSLLILTPFFLIIGTTLLFQFTAGFWFNFYLSAILVLTFISFVISINTTLHWSSWTLMYLALTEKKLQ